MSYYNRHHEDREDREDPRDRGNPGKYGARLPPLSFGSRSRSSISENSEDKAVKIAQEKLVEERMARIRAQRELVTAAEHAKHTEAVAAGERLQTLLNNRNGSRNIPSRTYSGTEETLVPRSYYHRRSNSPPVTLENIQRRRVNSTRGGRRHKRRPRTHRKSKRHTKRSKKRRL
jgi:hypothetical protein